MGEDWEAPTTLYKNIDELANNRLFGFIYTRYIKTLKLKGNENLLDFGSGSGAGSKHLAKILQNKGGQLFIKEPQRANDGMSVAQIKQLMSSNGFREKCSEEKSGAFSGMYKKIKQFQIAP